MFAAIGKSVIFTHTVYFLSSLNLFLRVSHRHFSKRLGATLPGICICFLCVLMLNTLVKRLNKSRSDFFFLFCYLMVFGTQSLKLKFENKRINSGAFILFFKSQLTSLFCKKQPKFLVKYN